MKRRSVTPEDLADICMVVEGTYPYVRGGVSSWIHNLVSALPEKTFRILFIGVAPEMEYELAYDLPENVIGVDMLYAQDFRKEKVNSRGSARSSKASKKAAWQDLKRFHDGIMNTVDTSLFDDVYRALVDERTRSLSLDDLFASERSWELITDLYRDGDKDASFVDYFWTWRFTHLPLFQMMQEELPRARLYHAVSTGYAGFIAVLAKKRLGIPMIITEHGIYTRERSIEIAQADWIYVEHDQDYKVRRTQGFFKQWWINMFRWTSRLCYQHADRIITITEVNQQFQMADGADPAKMSVIPNGIKLERYAGARNVERVRDEFVVGFIGRVVPIKDVKTFIRAIKMAVAEVPNLKAYIIGPTEEDAEYFAECKRLTRLLDLEEHIVYTGPANVVEFYARMHLLVLTSISEGQPLVILEGYCAGVPAVATNVGACYELVYGRTPEDKSLGASGIVTAVASPHETAEAIIHIAQNPKLRDNMVRAGIERVELFYREEDLSRTYLDVYNTLARKEETAE